MKRSARTRGAADAALSIHVKHQAKPSEAAAGLPPALNSGRRQRPCTIWSPAAKPDRTHAPLPTHPPTVSGHWRVVTVRSQTGAALPVGGPAVRGDEATSLPHCRPHVARQPWAVLARVDRKGQVSRPGRRFVHPRVLRLPPSGGPAAPAPSLGPSKGPCRLWLVLWPRASSWSVLP